MNDPQSNAEPTLAIPPAPASGPGPISHEERLKKLRRELYRTPEIIAAHFIMAIASIALGFVGAPVIVMAIIAAFGSALIILAVMSGSHVMVNMTLGYLILVELVVLGDLGAGAGVLALGMSIPLIMADLLRLNFARRRSASVDPRVFVGTLGFTFIVAIVSTLSIVIGASVAGEGERTWVWVPVMTVPILLLVSAAAIAIARKPGSYDKRRYRPGERMLPQPTVD